MHFEVAVVFLNWNTPSCYKFTMYLSTQLDYHYHIYSSEQVKTSTVHKCLEFKGLELF